MPRTYALVVRLESHEYSGEFYVLGEGYDTPGEVFEHVASEHLLRVADAACIEEYLLGVLNDGANASKAAYNDTNSAIECWIHVDVPYRNYAFGTGGRTVELSEQPTASELASKADELQSSPD